MVGKYHTKFFNLQITIYSQMTAKIPKSLDHHECDSNFHWHIDKNVIIDKQLLSKDRGYHDNKIFQYHQISHHSI